MATVWARLFPVPAGQCPRAQSKVHIEWIVEIGVEELDWPAQSPDLNPIKHVWDDLEPRRVRPNRPTSVPDLTNALVAEWKQEPLQQCSNI